LTAPALRATQKKFRACHDTPRTLPPLTTSPAVLGPTAPALRAKENPPRPLVWNPAAHHGIGAVLYPATAPTSLMLRRTVP